MNGYGDGNGNDDVDGGKDEDVSEANILVSLALKSHYFISVQIGLIFCPIIIMVLKIFKIKESKHSALKRPDI